jgi:tetratricopeptide (TPR) repeat protein
MRIIIKTGIAVFLSLALFACSSSKGYEEAMKTPEQKFYKGQYKEAARLLLPQVNKKGKNQLLFMMECGLMLHAAGDYKTSNKVLLPAAKLAKVIPISVTQQAASLLTNNRNTNYRGEDFEKVLVNMYLGLNFLLMGDYESARVEFSAVNNELSKIKTENGKARYKQNIMAKYLTAIAFEIIGEKSRDLRDIEFAYIEYKQIYALNPRLDLVKEDLLRLSKRLNYMDDYSDWSRKFGRTFNASDNNGELVTVFQAGRSAIKKSRGSLLKDPMMEAAVRVTLNTRSLAAGVTIATVLVTLHNAENPIPKFVKRDNSINSVRVNIAGKRFNTFELNDVEQTAVQNLEDDYGRLYGKVAAQVAIKAAASVAAGMAAKKLAEQSKQLGGFAGLIGAAAGLGTGAALFSQMKPDLRCWHTLPANFQLGREFLPPGKYTAKFQFMGRGGVVSTTEKEVEIKKGEKTLVNLRTLF